MKWYEKPVRMMRRDYVSDLQRMRYDDLDELARQKKEVWHVNCEWVIGTPGIAPGLGYQVTFNSAKFEKYEALGDWDLIREYLPYARKWGIHVLAYTNMHWFSYEFAQRHPDWEQVLADGTPYGRVNPLYGSGTTLCVNSGWRDFAHDLVRELMQTGLEGVFLDGPVVYPGCCYCPACRAKFRARYGAEIPEKEDWHDPLWKAFVDFREDSMAEFLRDARDAMFEIDPEGVIFLNAGSWHGGAWRVARDVSKVGPYQHFNGAEAFFHPGPHEHPLLIWATAAKHLRAAGKPSIVFSHHGLGAWHYLPLPECELKLSIAQTVACGSNPWLGVFEYSLDNSPKDTIRPVQEIQGFLEANEEYYTGCESAATVALVYSGNSAKYYLSERSDIYRDPGSGKEQDLIVDAGGNLIVDWSRRKSLCDGIQGNTYLGWFNALTRQHIPFDVLLDEGLTVENLARYGCVVLGHAPCLSDAQIAAIEEYVRGGGSVVAEFETGAYDERGNRRTSNPLAGLLGVANVAGVWQPAQWEEYALTQAGHPLFAGFAEGQWLARPVYALQVEAAAGVKGVGRILNAIGRVYKAPQGVSDWPLALCGEPGGRVAYLPALVGEFVARYKTADHERLLANAVRWAHREPLLIDTEAPGTLQIEPWRQHDPERLILHLVNNTGDMQRPMARIIPLRDVSLRVRCPALRSATRLGDGSAVAFETTDDGVVLRLSEVDLYEVIVLAF